MDINKNKPLTMHIDLNSAFASAEQQANHLLRGKPLAIGAYTSPKSIVISPSIEAKRMGVKTTMRIMDARLLCPNLIVRAPHYDLYEDIYVRLGKLFKDYSNKVSALSVDEAVIDYKETPSLDLVSIAKEIKYRLKTEIGDWLQCNIGISTNRFLGKLGASFNKPNGLTVIDHKNLLDVYQKVSLTDLSGIAERYKERLNNHGIFTPTQFLKADLITLKKFVFKSIVGFYWHQRLRGIEIDDVLHPRGTYGHDYSLKRKTDDPRELCKLLMKLCEKTGRRLRKNGYKASGVHLWIGFADHTGWHKGKKFDTEIYSTSDIYKRIIWLLNQAPRDVVASIGVSVFDLERKSLQESLFDYREDQVEEARDELNNRYGEFKVIPATMMGLEDTIIHRVSFGSAKDIEDLYN